MDKKIDWLSRKFWMCNGWGLGTTVVFLSGYISETTFKELIFAIVVGYLAANVFESRNVGKV